MRPNDIMLLGGLLAAFSLAGCTAAQRAAVGQGVEHVRQAKDTEAEALKASVCAISIGAYHRVNILPRGARSTCSAAANGSAR